MLVTAFTVCAATRVKSGPALVIGAVTACSADAAACSAAVGVRAMTSERFSARPDSTIPMRTPASSRPTMDNLVIMASSGHDDAARRVAGNLRHRDRQDAVRQIRADRIRV